LSIKSNYPYIFDYFIHQTDAVDDICNIIKLGTPEGSLAAEFTREEIKAALDRIGDLKAPGADGMPTIFYKHFWVAKMIFKSIVHRYFFCQRICNFVNEYCFTT
jgi:hypothetical protein